MKSLPKAIFCWSGGKDSAYCLHKVLTEKLFDVKYLLTTINENYKRISMHGVREELLDNQVESIDIPLLKVSVKEGSNQEYEKQMETVLLKVKSEGITNVIFGDIFLEDLRIYRENNLALVGMKGIFPLWKKNSHLLIHDFINKGFKSITCCTNDGYLGEDWVGREIDLSFIENLPTNVDPCGENGVSRPEISLQQIWSQSDRQTNLKLNNSKLQTVLSSPNKPVQLIHRTFKIKSIIY